MILVLLTISLAAHMCYGISLHRHLPEMPAHRPIMWVHISKAGGTTFCTLAKRYERVVQPNINCNWVSHDQAKLVNTRPHETCKERASYFQEHNFTWGQIERELNDGNMCFDDFDYGIMIRDPIDLAESLLNFFHFDAHVADKLIQCVESKGQGNSCDDLGPVKGRNIRSPPWYFMDNYLVRILGGVDVYNLPVGKITAEHADAVSEMLKNKFRAVLLFEDLRDNSVLDNVFHWSGLPTHEVEHVNGNAHAVKFTEEQRRTLRRLTMPDYKVYDFFSGIKSSERCRDAGV